MTAHIVVVALIILVVALAWRSGRREGRVAAGHASATADKLLRKAIDALNIIIFALDKDKIVRLSTGGALAPLSLRPGELVGQRMEDIMQNSPDGTRAVEAVFADGESRRITSLHHGPDGARWLRQEFVAIHADDGAVQYVAGIAFDVTDEEARAHLTETEALERSAARLSRRHA